MNTSTSQNEKKVLVVDDEPDILEIMKFYLTNEGFNVHCATNAEDALKLVTHHEFLFCITDLDMPKINGVDLINSIRVLRPTLPTCICSAKVTDFASEITRMAVSTTLPKPFFKDDFDKCIKSLLERSKDFEGLDLPSPNCPISKIMTTSIKKISSKSTCLEAIQIMGKENIGSIIIEDLSEKKVVGIFTERDLLKYVASTGSIMLNESIEKYMTKKIQYITSDVGVDDALSIMEQRGIRHLPVQDENTIIGIVSIKDLVKDKLKSYHSIIKNQTDLLKRYHLAGLAQKDQ